MGGIPSGRMSLANRVVSGRVNSGVPEAILPALSSSGGLATTLIPSRPMENAGLKGRLELIWWMFTLTTVVAVLLPIRLQTDDFPFYLANALYIVIAITFSRYAFLLRHTFLARMFWPKFIIIAFSAILVFVLMTSLGDVTNFIDEVGLQTLVDHLPIERQYKLIGYIRAEVVFFGVASIISAIILPIRMVISIWRIRNRGTV